MTKVSSHPVAVAVIAMALLLTIAPQAGHAQLTSGDLSGTVLDASGAAVANAKVVATAQSTNVKSTQTTTGAGEYHFANLPIGNYTIDVTAAGFGAAQVNDIGIDLNKQSTRNFTLQVGTTTTTVEVTESAATIDTSTAQITGNFDSQQAADLPSASSGSGVINLSLLQG
ncbi:MAG TPA: carboxypeptidase-like regulatory domain-containing protein, partial [Bryobacteraceae bacterium]|nr:carboxypeptidase-like regulatory domain-containing protein [Bryobacteraceae bacterium]